MFKEILTLSSEEGPLQYYVLFEKEGRRFVFDPTLKNKAAPVFVVGVDENRLYTEGKVAAEMEQEAHRHVRTLLESGFLKRIQ